MEHTTLESLLRPHVADVSTHSTTNWDGLPRTVAQFEIPHPVDRPYEEIKSTARFDARGRLIRFGLRPGPLDRSNWSAGQADDLLADAVEESDPPFDVRPYIRDHHGLLWRTHLDAAEKREPLARTSEAVDWLARFVSAYRELYQERKSISPEPGADEPACFQCEDRIPRHAFTARVTEDIDCHVGVCTECARDDFGQLPFVRNSMPREFNRRAGETIHMAEEWHVSGGARWFLPV